MRLGRSSQNNPRPGGRSYDIQKDRLLLVGHAAFGRGLDRLDVLVQRATFRLICGSLPVRSPGRHFLVTDIDVNPPRFRTAVPEGRWGEALDFGRGLA